MVHPGLSTSLGCRLSMLNSVQDCWLLESGQHSLKNPAPALFWSALPKVKGTCPSFLDPASEFLPKSLQTWVGPETVWVYSLNLSSLGLLILPTSVSLPTLPHQNWGMSQEGSSWGFNRAWTEGLGLHSAYLRALMVRQETRVGIEEVRSHGPRGLSCSGLW